MLKLIEIKPTHDKRGRAAGSGLTPAPRGDPGDGHDFCVWVLVPRWVQSQISGADRVPQVL